MKGILIMKKVLVEYEISERILDTVYEELQDVLDNMSTVPSRKQDIPDYIFYLLFLLHKGYYPNLLRITMV